MSKLKELILPDGRKVFDCGFDPLRSFRTGRTLNLEFATKYTSGLYELHKYFGITFLIEKESQSNDN